MKRFIIAGLLLATSAFTAEQRGPLLDRIAKLESEVVALKEENRKLRENAVVEERNRARKIYAESVIPMLKPMLKDLGLDESLLIPVEKVETLADAYRPLFAMIQKLSAIADLK